MILRNIYNKGKATEDSSALASLKERYPWWNTPRLMAVRANGDAKEATDRLVAMLHPQATIAFESIDPAIITRLSEEDIIDRFLLRGDYRIVAEDGDADDISKLENEEDEDMVSEELAEIYEKQGLYDEAITTYRKLSLLNSEKSIYFAGLIAKIEAIKCEKR
jgi:tetratricopeptide (TPR) repeat protein